MTASVPPGTVTGKAGPGAAVRPHRLPRPAPGAPVIRAATTADLQETVRLHAIHLPIGLFPHLGPDFLACWHAAFLDSPHAVAFVALDRSADGTEQIVGFLLGAMDRAAFRSELLTRHKLALGCRGALALITRPRLLRRFLRTRLSPYVARILSRGDRTPPSRPEPERITADLTAIAVDERARRSGAGRRLVDVFLDRCAAAGVPWVELVTATASPGAVAFYTATGWTPLREAVTRDGVHVQRFGREPNVPEGARG